MLQYPPHLMKSDAYVTFLLLGEKVTCGQIRQVKFSGLGNTCIPSSARESTVLRVVCEKAQHDGEVNVPSLIWDDAIAKL